MRVWDYDIPKDWKPRTEREWIWYLTRKINYGDWGGLRRADITGRWEELKTHLDPGKRMMFELYLFPQT